jgi:hypothetical protein
MTLCPCCTGRIQSVEIRFGGPAYVEVTCASDIGSIAAGPRASLDLVDHLKVVVDRSSEVLKLLASGHPTQTRR